MKIPSNRVGLRIALLYALLGGIWILLSDHLLKSLATNTSTLVKLQVYKDWIFVALGALLIFSVVRHELAIHKVVENGLSKNEGRVHELEDHARELEEKYRKLIERLPMVVYTTELGAVGFYHYVSPQIESLLGFTPEEWMADPDLWYQQVHPDDRDRQVALEEQAYIHNELIDSEYRIMRRDGQQIWLRDTIHILPPHGDGPPIVEGVLVDITERKYAEEALRESEEKYRLILENSMDAILLTAPDGRILSANQAACRMFEYNETELLEVGRNLIVDVTDPRLPVALVERERTGIFRGELTLIRNGGKKFPAEVSTVIFTDRNGKSMTSMIIRDIAESKQANEALRESEEKYRNLVEQLPAVVYVDLLDGKGTNLFISSKIETIFGVSDQEWLEGDLSAWADRIYPEDRQRVVDAYFQLSEIGQQYNEEYRIITRDGRLLWIHDKGDVLKNNTGDLILHGVMFDITALKQGETEREELLHVLEASLNEIYIFDPDTLKFEYVNRGALHNLGYSFEQLKTMTPLDIKPEFTETAFRELIAPMLQQEQEKIIFQTIHQRSDSSLYPTEVHLQLVQNPDRRVFLAIILDITERKKAEDALRAAEQDYRSIFENASIGIFRSTPEGRFLKINKTMAEIYGYASPEEMIQSITNISLQIHPKASSREHFQNLVKEYGEVLNLEKQNLRKDGSIIWTSTNARAVKNEADEIIYYEGFVHDITDRRQAEEALSRSRQHLEEAQRIAHLGSWDWVAETDFPTWSKELCAILEVDPDKPAPSMAEQDKLYTQESMVRMRSSADRALQTGEPYEIELESVRKDGSSRWLQARGERWFDNQGNVIGLRGTALDITEQKKAEERIRQQLMRLNGLHTIDIAISSSFELKATLDIVLKQAMSILNINACAILLCNTHTQILEYAASRGFHSNALQQTNLRVGHGFAGRVVLERKTMHVPNLLETGGTLSESLQLSNEKFADYYGTPLIVKGEVKGVLEIYHQSLINPDSEWLAFLETLATQAAIAIDNTQLFERLQRSNFDLILAYDATIEGWSRALDLRDKETEGHTKRVTNLTVKLAMQMGIPDTEILHIRRGALLHDIGKMGIPDRILLKPDKLDTEEWNIMRKHTLYANDMLSPIAYLKPALDIPLNHHEKWDGTGYPHQLQGEKIPLAARIFTVVDVWDALTSDRPYRKAWTEEKTIDYIREESGKHFDPQVVDIFLSMIR